MEAPITSPLLTRLDRFRRKLRALLITLGVARVVFLLVVGVMACCLLDYSLARLEESGEGLPAVVRLVLLLGGLGCIGWILGRQVVRPATAKISFEELAVHLEGRSSELRDRLATAVHFILRPPPESPRLVQATVQRAQRELASMPFEEALETSAARRPLRRMLFALLVGAGLILANPAMASTALQRLFAPFSAAAWPKWVQITPLTGDDYVAIGKPYIVRAQLTVGGEDLPRVTVVLIDPRGRRDEFVMTGEPDEGGPRYSYRIERVGEDLRYYFRTSGDSTAARPFTLRAVEPPELEEAWLEVRPPAYVADQTPRRVALQQGSFRFTTGSQLRIRLSATTPLAFGSEQLSALQITTQREPVSTRMVELARDGEARTSAQFSFVLVEPLRITPRLMDERSNTNNVRPTYSFEPVPDELPTVVVQEPAAQTDATPKGLVRIKGMAEDDFGIDQLAIEWILENSGNQPPGGTIGLEYAPATQPAGRRIVQDFAHAWNLGELASAAPRPTAGQTPAQNTRPGMLDLVPGDSIAYRVAAWDNFRDGSDQPREPGRSSERRIRIVSPEEFMQSVRAELAQVRSRLREVKSRQEALRIETDILRADLERGKDLSPADQTMLEEFERDQQRLSGATRQLAGELGRLSERMNDNQIPADQGAEQLSQIADDLAETGSESMARSAEAMSKARQSARQQEQRDAVEQSTTRQDEAINQMNEALSRLERWGDFNAMLDKAAELLSRQQDLAARTQGLGQQLLGKRPEDLNARERRDVAETAAEQNQLRTDTQELLNRAEDLANRTERSEPGTAQTLRNAVQAAQDANTTQEMQEASAEVQQNRMSDAQQSQQAAADGLRSMLESMRQRDQRQLDELARQLSQMREQVEQMLRRQEELTKANEQSQQETDPEQKKDQFGEQAGAQQQLRRDASGAADQMSESREMSQAARSMRQAAGKMRRAEGSLSQGEGDEAQSAQQSAEQDLREALEELRRLEEQAQQQRNQQTRAKIREMLDNLRNAQKATLARTDQIDRRREQRGRLLPADQRMLAEMSSGQEAWIKQLEEVRELLNAENVVTFVGILQRVNEDAGFVQQRFAAQQSNQPVQSAQQRIIERLTLLIEALDEQDPESENFQQDGGGGGGGGGGGQQPPLVPPLKQLIALRMLQEQVHGQTVELNQEHDQLQDDEDHLREVTRNGADQKEVSELMRKMLEALQQR